MASALAIARLSAQRSFSRATIRSFSFASTLRNTASASMPITNSVRNVAGQAQTNLTSQATAEGFKAGVLYTILAGSLATGAIIMLSPDGDRDVKSKHLL